MATDKRLLQIFKALPEAERETLLSFAEFLASRVEPRNEPVSEPVPIEPREGETVVGAIKRLSATYPMLDKSKMLNETSTLMTQYSIQGRDAGEVIQELEVVFRRHYERFLEESND